MAQDLRARAIQSDPNKLSARDDRLINDMLTAGIYPCPGGADSFKVQAQGTPNMTVRVGSGTADDVYVVEGVDGQGVFLVRNVDAYVGSGNTDLSIANGDATNDRIDGIDLQIYDDEVDSSGSNKAEIVVTQGTPAGSPTAPDVPNGAVRLATIEVAANESTSIGSGDITDLRTVSLSRVPSVRRYSTTIATAQTTSGSTELTLATLSVPAQPFAYELDVGMFATFQPTATDDFDVRIKVDGTAKAETRERGTGNNQRWTHAIPLIEPVDVAADTAVTVTVTIQRGSGTGTASTVQHAGRVTAYVTPQS